jgi:hypothetical protein
LRYSHFLGCSTVSITLYLLFFPSNNVWTNAPQCYVIRTLPVILFRSCVFIEGKFSLSCIAYLINCLLREDQFFPVSCKFVYWLVTANRCFMGLTDYFILICLNLILLWQPVVNKTLKSIYLSIYPVL